MNGETLRIKQGGFADIPPSSGRAWRIASGHAEAYAVPAGGGTGFHKEFLAELLPGDCFTPPPEGEPTYVCTVAGLEDTILEPIPSAGAEACRAGINAWFRRIARLPWLAALAEFDATGVGRWNAEAIAPDLDGAEADSAAREQAAMLAKALGGHFSSLDAAFTRHMEEGERYRSRMLTGSFGHLLKGELIGAATMASSVEDEGQPIRHIVKLVADYFKMDTAGIHLPEAVTRKMTPLTVLRRLADKAGMRIRLVTLPKGWETTDADALIGYFGANRELAALLPRRHGEYLLYSERHPAGLPVDRTVAAEVHPEAFACYAGLPPEKLDARGFLWRVLANIWTRDQGIILLTSLFASVIPLATPLITETIFSHIIPINDRQALGTVAQVMLVAGFTQVVLGFVRFVSCIRLKSRAGLGMEAMLWSRLINLPTRFFRDYQVGDLVNRMQGVSNIASVFDSGFISALFSVTSAFWTLLLMGYYNVRMTMFSLLVCGISLLVSAFIYRKAVHYQREAVRTANSLSARVLQLIEGLPVFRVRGAEDRAFFLWAKLFGNNWQWNLALRRQSNRIGMLNAGQPIILSMVMFYLAKSIFFDQGSTGRILSYAEFMAFMSLYAGFNASIMQIVPLIAAAYGLKPQLENLQPILASLPEVASDKRDAGPLTGQVEVKNVEFRYAPSGAPVLRDINLKIEPGQTVALVGASGGGKSTLVRLLLGFETPNRGGVYYDEQNLNSLNLTSVRSQIGVVLQHGQLMAGDIFTNIVGSMPLSLDDAWEAARKVGLAGDIKSMPMGMDTIISEGGGNVSGGQRQRILLARSIVNHPRILILDEATSALDNVTQKIVATSLAAMNATRIIVAHRLSTVRGADRICVINDGEIVEEGTYDELMAAKGWFRKLAQRQLL